MNDTKICNWVYNRKKATLETQCKMVEPHYDYIDRDALYAILWEAIRTSEAVYCIHCGKKINGVVT